MQPFDYIRPSSLAETSRLLAQRQPQARVLAGGVEILPQMELGLVATDLLLDIKHLPETTRIETDPATALHCGAAISLRSLVEQSEVRRFFPLLAQVGERIASPQIRNRATVGGAICAAAANSSLAPALLCYDAVCHLFGPLGTRSLPLAAFLIGPGLTALGPGEILTHITLPLAGRGAKTAYHQVLNTQSGHGPLVGVAAAASVDNERGSVWRLAVTGAASHPYRATEAEQMLAGAMASPDTLAAAATAVVRSCRPSDDHRASAAYRRALVDVLARRSLDDIAGQLAGANA